MVGLHHDTTAQQGVNLNYGWQASGDREFDDLRGGDQIDQLVFYFDIPVADFDRIQKPLSPNRLSIPGFCS